MPEGDKEKARPAVLAAPAGVLRATVERARVARGAREPDGPRPGGPRAGAGRAAFPSSSASRDRFGAGRGAGGAGGRGRPAGGVTSSGSGYRSSSGGYRSSPSTGAARGAGASGYRGSGAPYKSSSAGGSYRGRSPSGSAGPAPSVGSDPSGSRDRGARQAVDRDAVPGRRAQAFRSSSQREGGRPSSSGGWDRPAPRRDGPAASRRGGPGMHREEEAQSDSDSGPLPSSIGRAATTGRNLWPRPPRAPRPEPAARGEFAGGNLKVPAPSGRGSTLSGGSKRPTPARRSSGGPSKPFARGGRGTESATGRGSAKERRELGGDQVEGRQAVRELLAAQRRPVHEVWMMEGTDPASDSA